MLVVQTMSSTRGWALSPVVLCLLSGKQQLESPHEERVSSALHSVEVELQKLTEIPWLYYILHPNEDEVCQCQPACP